MKLISWNVNGIRALAAKNALSWVQEHQPDILCMQEIKATKEQIPANLTPEPFLQTYVNPALRRGYSGTMTLTNLAFSHTDTALHVDKASEGRIL